MMLRRISELKGLLFLFLVLSGMADRCSALGITVVIQGPPPFYLNIPGPVSLNEDASAVIDFFPTNTWGQPLSYTCFATHGTVAGSGTEWTYIPNSNFFGADTLRFTATDTLNNSSLTDTVSLTVNPQPDPPVANFIIPAVVLFPGFTNPIVIGSACDQPAQVTLDGSSSSDPDLDSLAYAWFDETNYLDSGVTNLATLDFGIHTATLFVTDGMFTNSVSVTFEVISPCTALANMEQIFDQAALPKKIDRHLRPMLARALTQLGKGKTRNARNELKDFHAKILPRIAPFNAAVAEQLAALTIDVLNALPDPRVR